MEIVGGLRCTPKHCDLSKGIVVDPAANTITFQLTAPDPDFLYKLALPPAFAVPASTPIRIRGPVPATGPYEFTSFDPKREVRLVRNPRFHQWSAAAQPAGYPGTIVQRYAGTPSAHVAAALAGKADLVGDLSKVPAPLLARVRTQHASRVRFVPQAATYALMFNLAKPPFDDVRARQALSLALDCRRLSSLVGRQGAVTCQILPPNFDAYQRYCPYTQHPTAAGEWTAPDLARARALVKQSGTAGEPVTVLQPTFFSFGKAAGEYVASVLRSLGYRARYGGQVNVVKIFAGEGSLSFNGWFADFLAPAGFFVAVDDCPENRSSSLGPHAGGLCNAALDREFARAHALQTTDPDCATVLWRKVDRDVTDLSPWVTYLNPVELELLSSRVGNYQYNPQWGTLLDQLWVR